MSRISNKDKAETRMMDSETVSTYLDLIQKGIEPASLTFISLWIFFQVDDEYPSPEAFLARIEAVIVPPIMLMTIIASSGGLGETLIKSLLVSQLMVLIAMIELEYDKDEGVYRLGLIDRLFIVSWIPLIYYILVRKPTLSASMGLI